MIARIAVLVSALFIAVPFPAAAQPKEIEPLEQQLLREGPAALAKATRTQGDPVRGAMLFYQPQLSCTKCHGCGGKQSDSPLGPDLSRPETVWTAEGIVESLLAPSKVIRKGY